MSLRSFVCSTLLVGTAFAETPAAAADSASADGKTHALLRVDTVKPGLVRRDALTLQGIVLGEARGGWVYTAEAKTVANKIVITVDGSASSGVVVAKNEAPFKTTVEVAELKDKKKGAYAVEVKGQKGELLWNGEWVDGQMKDTACPAGEVVVNRGTRSQFCAPVEGKCAPGRKPTVTPISAGQPMCVAEKQ